MRTRLLAVPGRVVNRSGRLVLRLSQRWPWAATFIRARERIRTLPPVPRAADPRSGVAAEEHEGADNRGTHGALLPRATTMAPKLNVRSAGAITPSRHQQPSRSVDRGLAPSTGRFVRPTATPPTPGGSPVAPPRSLEPVTRCRDRHPSAPIRSIDGGSTARGRRAWRAMLTSRPPGARRSPRPLRRPSLLFESAQSPHCIALEVATVRYIVEEKSAVTCDDAQIPWSDDDRHLLCKQEGVGSSPTVSTDKSAGQRVVEHTRSLVQPRAESAFGPAHDSCDLRE